MMLRSAMACRALRLGPWCLLLASMAAAACSDRPEVAEFEVSDRPEVAEPASPTESEPQALSEPQATTEPQALSEPQVPTEPQALSEPQVPTEPQAPSEPQAPTEAPAPTLEIRLMADEQVIGAGGPFDIGARVIEEEYQHGDLRRHHIYLPQPVKDPVVRWTSDIDGDITDHIKPNRTSGELIKIDLSPGRWRTLDEDDPSLDSGRLDAGALTPGPHTLTATFTADSGLQASDSIVVTILGPNDYGGTLRVPPVRGRNRADATEILKRAGYEVIVIESPYQAEAGTVIGQEPHSSAVLAPGEAVTITVSTGPEQIFVPDVRGQTLSQALQTLIGQGFRIGERREPSTTVEEGQIIDTDPPHGSPVSAGLEVFVIISDGPPLVAVPDVQGLLFDTGKLAIEQAGLVIGMVTFEQVEPGSADAGRILAQTPPPNLEVSAETLVDVVVGVL